MNDLTIIVSVYNTPGWTQHCLEKIRENTSISHKVIVINNGSRQNTTSLLEKLKEENYIDILIHNNENQGSYKSWNQGLNFVKSEFVAILHSDCIVAKNWHDPIIKILKSYEPIVACSSMTNYADQFYLRSSQSMYSDYVHIKPNNKIELSYNDIQILLDEYYMLDNGLDGYGQKTFNKFGNSRRYLTEMGTHCVVFKTFILHSVDWFDEDFFPHFGAESVLLHKVQQLGFDYVAALGSYCHHHGNATSDCGFNAQLMREKNEILVEEKIKRMGV